MPIYEYECPKHGRFEVQQRITEDALKDCRTEGCTEPVRKLISSTAFTLKGGGWYADGYSSTSKASGGDGSSSGGSGGASAGPACGGGSCASA